MPSIYFNVIELNEWTDKKVDCEERGGEKWNGKMFHNEKKSNEDLQKVKKIEKSSKFERINFDSQAQDVLEESILGNLRKFPPHYST